MGRASNSVSWGLVVRGRHHHQLHVALVVLHQSVVLWSSLKLLFIGVKRKSWDGITALFHRSSITPHSRLRCNPAEEHYRSQALD
ncbi:hypothetical protein V6N11_063190 [Hibiscus sabdariffa]|uniref:Secreted protein n=1 Tax=Hibiscus sabdariffa TaxID=183260 RepID=A0ABR2NWL3_9ROSI